MRIIKLNYYNDKRIKNIPYGLKKLICSSEYKYIKDFAKSDAPQFKGKSKEKKREMAIAAKLSK